MRSMVCNTREGSRGGGCKVSSKGKQLRDVEDAVQLSVLRICIVSSMDRRTSRGGDQGRDTWPWRIQEVWRDERYGRTLILSHLLPSPHHGALPSSRSLWRCFHSWLQIQFFSKMLNWQLTTRYYLRSPKAPPCHGLQIAHSNISEKLLGTNEFARGRRRQRFCQNYVYAHTARLECSPRTFLLNFHASFKTFLGSMPVSWIPNNFLIYTSIRTTVTL